MTITNGYTDLATLKANLDISDSDDDTLLENIVEAASRSIDRFTYRRFFTASETRYFQALRSDLVLVYDLTSVTTLKTDATGDGTFETTWTANTDYRLEPHNASLDGEPYTAVRRNPTSGKTFPTSIPRGVEIAGNFGYIASGGAVPEDVAEACLLLSARLFKRKDAVFGVTGSPETGQIVLPKMDPDVKRLLMPFRRITV